MTNYELLYESVPIILNKEEVSIYRFMCRQFNVDPDARLSGQTLEVSPFHGTQLSVMMARTQMDQMDIEGIPDDLVGEIPPMQVLTNILDKAAPRFRSHNAELLDVLDDFAGSLTDAEVAIMCEDMELKHGLEPRYPLDE